MTIAVHASTHLDTLDPFLKPDAHVSDDAGIPTAPLTRHTPGLEANAHYFGQPQWAAGWFKFVHRYPQLKERWDAAAGTWDDKIVVDIGCGPGNLHASLKARPRVLIGVDISRGTLEHAARHGYTPLLADAEDLPLQSEIADVVALNAALHHTDDVEKMLAEAARLVKPGGVLVADHDPHKSAYELRGVGRLLWKIREPLYRLMKRGGHRAQNDEQKWAIATEIHHKPGDGITEQFLRATLEPRGFDVRIYPHNHRIGKEVLDGQMGQAPRKMRIAQRLSFINPASYHGALSLLCVATRRDDPRSPEALTPEPQ